MIEWYLSVLKKYAEFSGRARRSEYWYFALANFIVAVVLNLIDIGIFGFGVLSWIYGLGVLIPGLAVGIRRLHDTNRSGWWLLLAFIPLIGAIVLIVFLVQEGTDGENQYGANPKLGVA